jgi:hypothetical protein
MYRKKTSIPQLGDGSFLLGQTSSEKALSCRGPISAAKQLSFQAKECTINPEVQKWYDFFRL